MSVTSSQSTDPIMFATLQRLVAAASLPPVASTLELDERGFDNKLLVGILGDGRRVLMRQNADPIPSPVARFNFLLGHGVGAPRLYAADDAGAVLVEFVTGETLAAMARRGALGDREWSMVGKAYGRVHAVRFPSPLRGIFGPQQLELTPQDPVDLLHSKVDTGEREVREHRPDMIPLLDRFRARIDARADELRREIPCLAHTDANFHNLVVAPQRVTLIDWDYPGVRYPLEELEAFETHAYLNGIPELPESFFAGYGHTVSRSLLRIHRIASCLEGFHSTEWSNMAEDPRNPENLRDMLREWVPKMRRWIYRLEDHLVHT